MEKILYVVPHLSTGGMPQYLLELIRTFKNQFDISVLEYNLLSSTYVVQRNKIKNECKLLTLGKDKEVFLKVIEREKPNIIHFQEIPETFIQKDYLKKIFNKDREYKIITTTHSSFTEPSKLLYTADKFVLVSEWSQKKFKNYFGEIDCDIWEYPIKQNKYEKKPYKDKLYFDDGHKHVLHVGLFTEGKNQSSIFELAKLCEDNDVRIKFHFVGNLANNFKDYWEPLLENKPHNSILYGEKANVDDFYMAADLFYFPSKWELNPISIKEALSFGLPVFTKKLDTYENKYDDVVTYIGDDIKINYENLLKTLNL